MLQDASDASWREQDTKAAKPCTLCMKLFTISMFLVEPHAITCYFSTRPSAASTFNSFCWFLNASSACSTSKFNGLELVTGFQPLLLVSTASWSSCLFFFNSLKSSTSFLLLLVLLLVLVLKLPFQQIRSRTTASTGFQLQLLRTAVCSISAASATSSISTASDTIRVDSFQLPLLLLDVEFVLPDSVTLTVSAVLCQKLWSVFICLFYLLNVTYLLLPLTKSVSASYFHSFTGLSFQLPLLLQLKVLILFQLQLCVPFSPLVWLRRALCSCGKMSDLLLPTVATTDKCTWIT